MERSKAIDVLAESFKGLLPEERARLVNHKESGGKFLCGDDSGAFSACGIGCPAVIAAGLKPTQHRAETPFDFGDDRSRILAVWSRMVLGIRGGEETIDALSAVDNQGVYDAIDLACAL